MKDMMRLLNAIYSKLEDVTTALHSVARRLGDLESEIGRQR